MLLVLVVLVVLVVLLPLRLPLRLPLTLPLTLTLSVLLAIALPLQHRSCSPELVYSPPIVPANGHLPRLSLAKASDAHTGT